MARQPYIPRKSPIAGQYGLVSRDWDASFFQPLIVAIDTGTTAGVFANNAAALAGGLLVGQVYHTAAGDLRIVV